MMTALTRRGSEAMRKGAPNRGLSRLGSPNVRGSGDLARAREGIEAARRRLREQAVFVNRLGKKVARLKKNLERERARLTRREPRTSDASRGGAEDAG